MRGFHVSHGPDILLSGDGKLASRRERKGKVDMPGEGEHFPYTIFSKDPLKPGETCTIRLEEEHTAGYLGQIPLGVSAVPPHQQGQPRYAKWLEDAWVLAGDVLHTDGQESGRFVAGTEISAGDTIGMTWTESGDVIIHVNKKILGCAFQRVQGPVWAVFDITWVNKVSLIS